MGSAAMSPIQWSPALAVGVPEIDAQHQELFRRAERLITALRGGDRAEVTPLVRYLTDYAVEHFAAEERFMREIGFLRPRKNERYQHWLTYI